MNKKGHVGTIMLVIGAFLLVVSSLYFMLSSNTDLSLIKAQLRSSSDFVDVSHSYLIKDIKNIIDNSINESNSSINFEMSFNESLKKFASEKRTSGLNNNLYAKIALGNYSLQLIDGKYNLIVPDVFENYNFDNNEITYSYSLKVVFDKEKVISIEEIVE